MTEGNGHRDPATPRQVRAADRRMDKLQNYGERRWEFDLAAINGEEVVVVEVQTTLRVPDVDRFSGALRLTSASGGSAVGDGRGEMTVRSCQSRSAVPRRNKG